MTIENRNAGDGQAAITARLRSKSTGETAAQSSETVELRPHETLQVMLELRPGTVGEYDAVVEVQYPRQ